MKRIGPFLCGAAVGLSACANLISSHTTDKSREGFGYSLPVGHVLFTASRTPIDPSVFADATDAATKTHQAVVDYQKPVDVATQSGDKDKLAAANTALQSAKDADKVAQLKLTVAKNNQGKWQESASFTAQPLGPDPNHRFVAHIRHRETRDDTVVLSAPNGMLSSSSITSIDQTPNIIITLADTAITVGAMGTRVGLPAGETPPSPSPPPTVECNYSISRIIDPTSPGDLKALREALTASGASIEIQAPGVINPTDNTPATVQDQDAGTSHAPDPNRGLLYRLATQAVLFTTAKASALKSDAKCPLASLPTAQTYSAVVPDTRSTFLLRTVAGAFTTTNLTFGFSNGMLTDYTYKRPSEVAAIAGIPLRIANDIIQIPAQILQLRVNLDTQKTALVNAEAGLASAKVQTAATLLTARTAVVNARTALDQADLNGPAAVAKAKAALEDAEAALKKAQAANQASQ